VHFVMAFERECTEICGEAHAQTFDFFGGVPQLETWYNDQFVISTEGCVTIAKNVIPVNRSPEQSEGVCEES